MGISRRCARLSYVAIVVHGSCSPQAPIAPHVWYGLRALCQAHRLPPSHSTHLIVFSACAIKIAPFTSLALRSQRRLGTVSPFGLLPLQNPFGLHTPYCLVALSSLGLRFAPVGISRRCARLSYVAIVVHGSCSPQAPIAPHVWYGLRALCQAHRLPPSHSTHLMRSPSLAKRSRAKLARFAFILANK